MNSAFWNFYLRNLPKNIWYSYFLGSAECFVASVSVQTMTQEINRRESDSLLYNLSSIWNKQYKERLFKLFIQISSFNIYHGLHIPYSYSPTPTYLQILLHHDIIAIRIWDPIDYLHPFWILVREPKWKFILRAVDAERLEEVAEAEAILLRYGGGPMMTVTVIVIIVGCERPQVGTNYTNKTPCAKLLPIAPFMMHYRHSMKLISI